MIIITTVSATRFSLNGIQYFKNYISEVAGSAITVYNAYDRKDVKVDFVNFAEISLNGFVYGNVADLQSALLPVIYTRAGLGSGGGAEAFTDLTDVPSSYTGQGGKVVAVKDDATGLEFIEAPSGEIPTLASVLAVGDRNINQAFDGDTLIDLEAHLNLVTCDQLNVNTTFTIPTSSDFNTVYPLMSIVAPEFKILNNSDLTITLESDTGVTLLGDVLEIPKNSIACVKLLNNVGDVWSVTYQTNSVGGGGAVDSVNGQTGVVVLDAEDVGAEPTITATTSADYYRGDKTFQPAIDLPINTATQTALDTKTLPLICDEVDAVLTGVAVDTQVKGYLIPAGTLTGYNRLVLQSMITKDNGTGTSQAFWKINTTNNYATATQIARSQLGSTLRITPLDRRFKNTGSNLVGFEANIASSNDSAGSTVAISTTAFNDAVDNYIFIGVNPNNIAETHTVIMVEINARRKKTTI
jgi:hypothetical protein